MTARPKTREQLEEEAFRIAEALVRWRDSGIRLHDRMRRLSDDGAKVLGRRAPWTGMSAVLVAVDTGVPDMANTLYEMAGVDLVDQEAAS